jgi:peptidoglycan hydrolase-like protein with peptidoglycan-binding domain
LFNVNIRPGALALLALLTSCATQPIGPTVQVMPAAGKPFDKFAQEEEGCKTYAQGQIAGAVDNANRSAAGGALLTTALGTTTGALLGGGEGARVGTAGGVDAGTGVAADMSANSQNSIQQRYDVAYSQCMYAKGNQVPGMEQAAQEAPPAPAPAYVAPRFDPELVAAIQRELGRIGLLAGAPDGAYGPRTRAAIVDYERTRALPADGIPTASLLADLQKS